MTEQVRAHSLGRRTHRAGLGRPTIRSSRSCMCWRRSAIRPDGSRTQSVTPTSPPCSTAAATQCPTASTAGPLVRTRPSGSLKGRSRSAGLQIARGRDTHTLTRVLPGLGLVDQGSPATKPWQSPTSMADDGRSHPQPTVRSASRCSPTVSPSATRNPVQRPRRPCAGAWRSHKTCAHASQHAGASDQKHRGKPVEHPRRAPMTEASARASRAQME